MLSSTLLRCLGNFTAVSYDGTCALYPDKGGTCKGADGAGVVPTLGSIGRGPVVFSSGLEIHTISGLLQRMTGKRTPPAVVGAGVGRVVGDVIAVVVVVGGGGAPVAFVGGPGGIVMFPGGGPVIFPGGGPVILPGGGPVILAGLAVVVVVVG